MTFSREEIMTKEERDLEDWVIPQLTDEFLDTLVHAACVYGHSGDWVAVRDFVRETFVIAGKEPPEMEPYDKIPEKAKGAS